jgi:O-antigen ligase
MIRDSLLALGLLLSTASQLRPAGLPIGPGEVCLLIWVVLMLGEMGALLHAKMTPALSRMLLFWIFFSISLCLGSATAYAISDIHDPNLFIHDILAYAILFAVSLLCTVGPAAGCHIHRAAWLLTMFSTIFLGIQLLSAWSIVAIPGTDPWYWERFRGLSENPNQLAIFCAVVTFLSVHFIEHVAGLHRKIIASLCAALSIYVGRLTKSDTYAVILVTGILLFAALKLRSWLVMSRHNASLRRATTGIALVSLPMVAATAFLFTSMIEAESFDLMMDMAKGTRKETSETANIRLNAWRRAIDRGIESGMLGLGPGPHIEIPSVLVAARRETAEPKYIEHPQVNGTPNFEAHNTFLDLFTQGGLIGTLSFIWLIAMAFQSAYRKNLDALAVVVWSIIALSIFHLIIRQPLFWFAIAFALAAGTESCAPSPLLGRSK